MKAGKVYIVPIILLLILVMCITIYSIVINLNADNDTLPTLPSAEVSSVPTETIPTIIAGDSNRFSVLETKYLRRLIMESKTQDFVSPVSEVPSTADAYWEKVSTLFHNPINATRILKGLDNRVKCAVVSFAETVQDTGIGVVDTCGEPPVTFSGIDGIKLYFDTREKNGVIKAYLFDAPYAESDNSIPEDLVEAQ